MTKPLIILICAIAFSSCDKQKSASSIESESQSLAPVVTKDAKFKYTVLEMIETYEAPPYPESKYVKAETYNVQRVHGFKLPPSYKDVFAKDACGSAAGADPFRDITKADIIDRLNSYRNLSYKEMNGLRPWTHSNFVKSLNEKDFSKLQKELIQYALYEPVKASVFPILSSEELNQYVEHKNQILSIYKRRIELNMKRIEIIAQLLNSDDKYKEELESTKKKHSLAVQELIKKEKEFQLRDLATERYNSGISEVDYLD